MGGGLDTLGASENSIVNLYAYDVVITHTGGFWDDGQVTGKYYLDDASFIFDLWGQNTYSHINVIPEPASILLLSLGLLFLRKKRVMVKKEIITTLVIVMFFGVSTIKATVWESGHHEILDGNIFGEIWMYNDATATMSGGDVFKLEMFDTSAFEILGGTIDLLGMRNNSISYIRGGNLGALGAIDNSVVNLYAYDVIHHPTGGHYDQGWVEGKYYFDDSSFDFDLGAQNTYQHINIIPEPSTFFLLVLGFLVIRRRK